MVSCDLVGVLVQAKRWQRSLQPSTRFLTSGEAAAADGLAGDDVEEDLDHVQPEPAGRREAQRDPRVARQPGADRGPGWVAPASADRPGHQTLRSVALLPRNHGWLRHPDRATISSTSTPAAANSTICVRCAGLACADDERTHEVNCSQSRGTSSTVKTITHDPGIPLENKLPRYRNARENKDGLGTG